MPKNSPTTAERPTPITTLDQGSAIGTLVKLRTATATIQAMQTPAKPPVPARTLRFHQVLIQNVAAPRAQRFTDADLVCALRHHGQHDVHDHDAAHHHEDADDADGHGGDRRGELVPEIDDGVRREQAEVIVLAGPQVPVGAEKHTHLVFRLGQLLLLARLGNDADSVSATVRFEVALDRDHHEIVQRVAEHAAQRLGSAHHFVGIAFDLDDFADRIAPLEEAIAHIVAQKDNGSVTANLFVGDAAAGVDLYVIDGGDIVRDALHIHAQDAIALERNASVAGSHHADFFEQGRAVLDELVFVRPDLRIPLLHLHELLGIERAEPRHADYAETIGAHVGDLLRDVQVHPMDEGGHGDQRGGSQNDPEQGKKTTQFVFAERIESDPGSLPERCGQAEFASLRHCA